MKAIQPHRITWGKAGLILLLGDIIAISLLYEIVHYIRLVTSVYLLSNHFFTVLATVLLTLYVTDV